MIMVSYLKQWTRFIFICSLLWYEDHKILYTLWFALKLADVMTEMS